MLGCDDDYGLVACSDDVGKTIPAYTEAEKLWIAQNQAYFQEKKVILEDDGQLLYQQLVVEDDTLLYRILEIGEVDSVPTNKIRCESFDVRHIACF